jgi:hypothetical protein
MFPTEDRLRSMHLWWNQASMTRLPMDHFQINSLRVSMIQKVLRMELPIMLQQVSEILGV